MAMLGPGRPANILSSVSFQIVLKLTPVYFAFYFLFTLGLIIRKSLILSYPVDNLVIDVAVLFILAALEILHYTLGVRGNLTESEPFILAHLILTGVTILLTVFLVVWQTYVMLLDEVLGGILVVVYGLDGVLAFSTFARLASVYS